eukprot:3710194-Prymnesium_polylepis.1
MIVESLYYEGESFEKLSVYYGLDWGRFANIFPPVGFLQGSRDRGFGCAPHVGWLVVGFAAEALSIIIDSFLRRPEIESHWKVNDLDIKLNVKPAIADRPLLLFRESELAKLVKMSSFRFDVVSVKGRLKAALAAFVSDSVPAPSFVFPAGSEYAAFSLDEAAAPAVRVPVLHSEAASALDDEVGAGAARSQRFAATDVSCNMTYRNGLVKTLGGQISGLPPFELELGLYSPVLLLRNVDVERGLTNGTRGIVMDLTV